MLWPVLAADPASLRVQKRFWWWVGMMVRPQAPPSHACGRGRQEE